LIWLGTGAGDGLLLMQPRTFECHKMWRISWLAEDLLALSRRSLLHGVSFVFGLVNALPKTGKGIIFSSESDINEKSGFGNLEEQELTPHTRKWKCSNNRSDRFISQNVGLPAPPNLSPPTDWVCRNNGHPSEDLQ
jgi:hypothetical protein